jgi:glycosyltransferase involved in cell wall biosynthesis
MRCVIDLQGAQSESRFRGIGRYCLNLALAMARQTQGHELWLALNATWPERVLAIRSAFSGVLQQDHIVAFNVPTPCAELDPRNDWRARVSEKVRERFLEELNPDVVYVSSLFEGLGNNSVTSIESFARNLPTAAVLYDLIPLLRPEEYLPDARRAEWYNRKLESFRKADLLTAISESSRQEAVQHAQIPADSIVNIGCGVDAQFRPLDLGNIKRAKLRRHYRITGSFFMYSGAVDSHKNLDGLIAAFALLPGALRKSHQLVIVGAHDSSERERLLKQVQAVGLRRNSVVFTGYVPDEDLIALYNECALFILPSFHEGFGLPAAEAMACGAPTIGANATSIPEVIGRNDALFDPCDPSAIAGKINEVMTDDDFRRDLINHGLLQSQQFTWERSAQQAWRALEELHIRRSGQRSEGQRAGDAAIGSRPLLAYFSPLPPVPSGIADYSAELLPELARYYEIENIVFQPQVTDDRIRSNFAIRSLSYFEANSARYSRILYHMGNSPYHTHMWRMMERYPGTLVLHDFYQSDLLNWVEREVGVPDAFSRALYDSHGYSGLLRDVREGREAAKKLFPCNRHVLDAAAGIIVHSRHSIALAEQWYGPKAVRDWTIIPQLRKTECPDRGLARARLGFADGDYVVCTFGMIGDTKLNHRLLAAWAQSALATDSNCKLVFVGEMHGGEYGRQLLQEIQSKRLSRQVFFTGLADARMYCDYLSAADQAVQLRTSSRGETSRAVLDCLAYGVPTIVNAHGSLCDLPADAVLMVPDEFGDGELAAALEALHVSPDSRRELSLRGTALIRERHDPSSVAEQYRQTIEGFAKKHRRAREEDLLNEIGNIGGAVLPGQTDLVKTASAVAHNRILGGQRQLLMDVSATAKDDLKTGIERVARAIVMKSIEHPPAGFRVEPVRGADSRYVYARNLTLQMLESNVEIAETPVEVHPGDIYLGLDWSSEAICSSREFFAGLQAQGVRICFLVYDLLPIQLPHRFPPGIEQLYQSWLEVVVAVADKLIAISKATADELVSWLETNRPERLRSLQISYWHLGADIQASSPSKGLPAEAQRILSAMQDRPSFLMVGTMEPRKGHAQVLSAFDQLWAAGLDVNLVIVGKQGWMMEALAQRIQRHRESGKRLFWLAGISDEMLLRTYENAAALIAASEGEGFGLPLIEAARAKVPIIARDLQVFREVASDHAFYFSGTTPDALSSAVRQWLSMLTEDAVPRSENLKWADWKQSAAELMDIVLGDTSYREWPARERQSRDAGPTVLSSQDGGGPGGLSEGSELDASRATNQEHPV